MKEGFAHPKIFKLLLKYIHQAPYIWTLLSGNSSVVEHLVANEKVVPRTREITFPAREAIDDIVIDILLNRIAGIAQW